MLIKKPDDIKSSEITDKTVYLNRRLFMHGAALLGTTVATGLVYRKLNPAPVEKAKGEKLATVRQPTSESAAQSGFTVNEKLTPIEDITNYNNFYEFSTDKHSVASASRGFVTRPWTVSVGGLVNKPTTFDLEELLRFPQEDRVYRLRCVEGWSMVIPWVGFPLSKLLDRVEPNSQAKYVAFQTLYDPKRMPNQATGVLDWPYVEGLRLDEAMHPLAILATGLYGETLPPPDGAPVRLVVPWKYGFKSIKSIVKIALVAEEPPTTWNIQAPNEYGFYSNVNPNVPHPRWSQAQEHRIGEFSSRNTLLFNGYAEQVASFYTGMDLRKYF
ncbi:MAG TPA: protein-methionine-sulfoxide reductase catalytic subunit MsrP [Blastocatellia bacterium]|jgi:sulfoxide reductase catalytic subunit YedY|nr:protein-methionine-sulfoxide reductase catalytic subunit MsrP [Blastocatellia bacterium]HAF22296.1 protein-methionine-sulfoxide reductase catalytic subunit MsrP [Blastocatellia bacterium]HCX30366.1 protein-methionine-sulfoxide reductase catalytic subunit MsrP [Blastocatellia bacterium]